MDTEAVSEASFSMATLWPEANECLDPFPCRFTRTPILLLVSGFETFLSAPPPPRRPGWVRGDAELGASELGRSEDEILNECS